jgi:DNA-directed RNA polymerase omega subunit
MGYPPLEEMLPKSGYSIYRLVRMAANRAIELADGKQKLIHIDQGEKTTTIALEEIRAGKVVAKELAQKNPSRGQIKEEKPSSAEEQSLSEMAKG